MPPFRIMPEAPPGWSWQALMALALEEGGLALQLGEVPVGAVLAHKDGRILGRGHNNMLTSHNPAGHAEINALAAAGAALGNYRLNDTVLVVTLEPCLMCAGAIAHARVGGVVFGAPDPKAGALVSCLEAFELPFLNHRPWHCGNILEEECRAQLQGFFAARRKERGKA